MPRVPDIEEATSPDPDLGIAIFLALAQPSRWLHRRVEHVRFADASNLRRRTSLDFSIPEAGPVFEDAMEIIPLAVLSKGVLLDVDVVDESGASLPVLTRSQNAFVGWSMLAGVASYEIAEALGETAILNPALEGEMRDLLLADPQSGRELLTALLDTSRSGGEHREILGAEHGLFGDLASELVDHFLLLTELDPDPGQRRVVKFSYIRPLHSRPGRTWERFVGRMGWWPIQFDFDIPAIGEARSYHFEFMPPEGLEISAGEVSVTDPESERVQPLEVTGSRAHAYIPNEPPEADGVVSLWLKAPRVGLLRALLMTSAVIALVLWVFLVRLDGIMGDAASAILLGIPGIVATFIVRPGEHRLASDLLLGIRAAGGTAGLSAYLAAVALVTLAETALTVSWLILAVVASLCFASLVVSYLGLAPRWFGEASSEGAEDGQES